MTKVKSRKAIGSLFDALYMHLTLGQRVERFEIFAEMFALDAFVLDIAFDSASEDYIDDVIYSNMLFLEPEAMEMIKCRCTPGVT